MEQNLHSKFRKNLPDLYSIAKNSADEKTFIDKLGQYIQTKIEQSNDEERINVLKSLSSILENENKTVKELSTGSKIYFETFTNLWYFLKFKDSHGCKEDLFTDLYMLFCAADGKLKKVVHKKEYLAKHMARWKSGLDREVRDIRETNIESIIEHLIDKIDRKQPQTRYHFEGDLSRDEKREIVKKWWDEYQFHLIMAIKSPSELNTFLNGSITLQQMRILQKAKNKGIPFFITPYYLSLLNQNRYGYDDYAVRSYILYSEQLVNHYGNIKAWEKEDIVVNGEPNAAGWYIPDSSNVHRRYPEVAIVIPDTRGRGCAGLCASCQRLYGFQKERLNFDFDSLKPKESWDKKLNCIMKYFENDSQLRDLLLTGGDALMSKNKTLEKIFDAILKMAKNKIEANKERPEGEKFAEIKRIRLGSRLPAYLPIRIDQELIEILKKFKEQGEKLGIEQFVLQTHFQSPLEVTKEAKRAIEMILSSGWIITNQMVFNAASSRIGHTAKLRQTLNSLGVITYYTFTVKGFEENRAVFAPNSRSMQENYEEKGLGKLSMEQTNELLKIFNNSPINNKEIRDFLKRHSIPFIASDRNVLNLPAVGKSMSFSLAGITHGGERVLKFDHDPNRKHSPIIDKMGEVYIKENRSILSYLCELERMGEKVKEYESIWGYTYGETEPLFPLFKYPNQTSQITSQITNFDFNAK